MAQLLPEPEPELELKQQGPQFGLELLSVLERRFDFELAPKQRNWVGLVFVVESQGQGRWVGDSSLLRAVKQGTLKVH